MLGSLGAGNILLADAAYDSDALRQTLADRGAWANVKPMPRRRNVPAFSYYMRATWQVSIRRACRALPVDRSTYHNRSRRAG